MKRIAILTCPVVIRTSPVGPKAILGSACPAAGHVALRCMTLGSRPVGRVSVGSARDKRGMDRGGTGQGPG